MKIKIIQNFETHLKFRKRAEWVYQAYSTPHLNLFSIIRYFNNFKNQHLISEGVATETGYILQMKGLENDDPISFINIKEREKICELLIKRDMRIVDGVVTTFLDEFSFNHKLTA